jgi:hypothetical protein
LPPSKLQHSRHHDEAGAAPMREINQLSGGDSVMRLVAVAGLRGKMCYKLLLLSFLAVIFAGMCMPAQALTYTYVGPAFSITDCQTYVGTPPGYNCVDGDVSGSVTFTGIPSQLFRNNLAVVDSRSYFECERRRHQLEFFSKLCQRLDVLYVERPDY